ncbi:hypothetical protein PZE06_14175 [Robertmurraya sp. DFI.2.37]|uniref:hypothetical protein n=1 Tax=Robertmurraya sp. DFI.2.37 TaxID=3031819 RepID=UPI0012443DB6|nr:hypothetical protein [Robertmurraya sp. DFI.2.37]MDF1509318.1 hypothetical protein [Robertmurraya sp. DFI.2.37]
MAKIKIFYFFIILVLLILFFGLFGTINDRIILLISDTTVQDLSASAIFHKILFALQALALLAIIFVIYKNGLPFKREGKKLTKKSISTILTISLIMIVFPYAVLMFL